MIHNTWVRQPSIQKLREMESLALSKRWGLLDGDEGIIEKSVRREGPHIIPWTLTLIYREGDCFNDLGASYLQRMGIEGQKIEDSLLLYLITKGLERLIQFSEGWGPIRAAMAIIELEIEDAYNVSDHTIRQLDRGLKYNETQNSCRDYLKRVRY